MFTGRIGMPKQLQILRAMFIAKRSTASDSLIQVLAKRLRGHVMYS